MKYSFMLAAFTAATLLLTSCKQTDARATEASTATLDSLNTKLISLEEKQKTAETNKKIVLEFYTKVFGDKDLSVINNYLVEDYIQHNPAVADGRASIKAALEQWFKGAPKETLDIHHMVAEDDLVFLHLKTVQMGKPVAIVDIFKLKDGKIIEHWDVIQEVPEKAANAHPMF